MLPPSMSPAQLAALLAEVPAWRQVGRELHAEWRFPDFAAAVAFTMEMARAAERLDHHPEWTVRSRRVAVLTTTHDTGGLSERDDALARAIAQLATAHGGIAAS